MENERNTNLVKALEKIGYDNPDQSAENLIDDLKRKGQFLYVTHPKMVHSGRYQTGHLEPVYMRLSRN